MPQTIENQGGLPPSGPPPPMRWQSWPMRDDPLRGAAALAGLALLGLLVFGLTGQVHLAALAVLAMAAAAWRFFIPVMFEMGDEGIDQWVFGRRRHIPWSAIGHHEVGPDGVVLLPTRDRSPTAWLRAVHVPWRVYREEVLAHVQYHLGPAPNRDG